MLLTWKGLPLYLEVLESNQRQFDNKSNNCLRSSLLFSQGLVSPFALTNFLHSYIIGSLRAKQLSHMVPSVLVKQWYLIY